MRSEGTGVRGHAEKTAGGANRARAPWPAAWSSRTLVERALKSHETRKEMHGEREGTTASSPRAKNGGGDEARMADHGEQRTAAFCEDRRPRVSD